MTDQPLTDAELAEIEARCNSGLANKRATTVHDLVRLTAEVRRLWDELWSARVIASEQAAAREAAEAECDRLRERVRELEHNLQTVSRGWRRLEEQMR